MSVTWNAAEPAPRWRRAARWTLSLLLALWCALLAAWLLLHWAILPHIDEWRPQVERRASEALGVAVRIGAIEVRSGGWVPAFELRDVVLVDAVGREALRLPRVAAALSPRSLLAFEPRFAQLLIDGLELEVRVDALGRLQVAGLAVDGPGGDDGRLADWFFAQHEFVVRGGRVRWIDERRLAPPLALDDLTLVVRNGVRRHLLRLDATPPPQWGERFSVRGRFTQSLLARAGDWRRWSGTLHVDLPRADVAQLRRYAALPFEVSEGHGALRGWLELADGRVGAATLDVALADVALRLAPTVQPIGFERIEGRLDATRRPDALELIAERFAFRTAGGGEWPAGRLALTLRDGDGGGEFSAERLDLALMAGIAAGVPLGGALQGMLDELKPRGQVSGLAAGWEGPLDAPLRYRAAARIAGLSLASRPAAEAGHIGRPGIDRANVELLLSERGGEATLAIADGALHLPGVFERPELALQKLAAKLSWRIDAAPAGSPAPIEVQLLDARFANADAAGTMKARWRTGAGDVPGRGGRFPGQLDLDATLQRAQAAAVARYLPLGIPQPARRYVEHAVKAGHASKASFKVKGDLWDFPFHDVPTRGQFRIAATLHDVALDYVPSVPEGADEPAWRSPWPGLTQLNGELLYDGSSLRVRGAQGQLAGVAFGRIDAAIGGFGQAPTVEVDAEGRGPLDAGLGFVRRSPVGEWIEGALAQASGSGAADLKLKLRIPIEHPERGSVQGSVQLAGNDVRIGPELPLLAQARGRVDFSERGFTIADAVARVAGGEATISGGSRPGGGVRISARGSATADGLARLHELPLLARLATSLSGQTGYQLALGLSAAGTELEVTSDLLGLASSLPPPLAKRADAALPLRWRIAPAGAGRDELRLQLGELLQAHYLRDTTAPQSRVLAGGIGVGAPAPALASGVHAVVDLGAARIDADAWQATAGLLGGGSGEGAGGYQPTRIALRAAELVAEGRRLTRLVAGISLVDGVWRANLDADQLDGHVEWSPPARVGGAGRLHARLARLALPPAEAQSIDSLLDRGDGAAGMPALDIVIDDFELRGRRLGRVEVEAINRRVPGDADAREWRLSKLLVAMPEARFSATGQWLTSGAPAARRSLLDFKLELADSGALLERLGFGSVVRGGQGLLQGEVSWRGSPLAFDAASLSGQLQLALGRGQFLKADPGVGRLLGVLSLQALPRRLSLDFRDLFQQGFAFDDVTGDIRIDAGVARSNNLRMRGVQAAVLMEGSADLGRETQDLRVVVVPEINAATASLAYAVINPAIGVGTFLAQLFLRRPLAAAATREFRITGAWADPKVERVERSPAAPAGGAADDAAAAAAPPPARTP